MGACNCGHLAQTLTTLSAAEIREYAYEKAGGTYYPKLQVSVPFTPVTGPRLLVRPGAAADETRTVLASGMMELARKRDVSSLHVTFCEEKEWRLLTDQGFLKRMGQQFHWHNRGYESFDDFLGCLSSRNDSNAVRTKMLIVPAPVTSAGPAPVVASAASRCPVAGQLSRRLLA